MGDGGPVKFSFFSVVKYRLKSISDIAKTQYILVFFRQPVFNAYPFAANLFIRFNLIYSSKSIKNPRANWRI